MCKKNFLISSFCTIILIIGLSFIIMDKKEEKNNNNDTNVEIKKASSFLTLMLQQDDGTYQKSTTNTWPNEDYVFNEKLSQCENGGELYWDAENLIVKLISSGSDKCYVYFDKSFIYPKIIDYAKSVTLFKGDKLYFNEDTLSYVSSYPIEKIEISIDGVYYYRSFPDSFAVNLNPGSYGVSLAIRDSQNNVSETYDFSVSVLSNIVYDIPTTLNKGDSLFFNDDTVKINNLSFIIEEVIIVINGVYYYRSYPDSFTVNLNPGSYGLSLYFCDNNNQCEGASYSITVV